MVKVEIFLKEAAQGQLVVSIEPHMEGCSELEKTAAIVLKKHVNAALDDFYATCEEHTLDLEGDKATAWHRKLFGD